ncbi:cytochrome P450 2K1-like [Acipenser oxyrinchus oxyrinchus]|uniref:Cytochrome P450 2K1-like n=1 Tax=Acipenser oxyrinchus oxyrinchus TaxID=40147 RepID=A0AAD8CUK6_ACIOX|nr:cytochrome P450 2K1-like [Acipenser oxyrinchus oxyrinchus]
MSVISLLLAHTATVSLALVLTGFIFLYFYAKSSKSCNYNFPPGPPALPVIGNLNILDLHRPHKTLSKLSETYGNVFTFHMGPKKYLVLTGYEAVNEALVTQADDFSERGQTHTTEIFSKGGNGIAFGKGESWKVMRRFTLSTLRALGMGKKTIEDRIIEESQRLVDVFQSHKGKPFDPQIIINSAVSNIICSIMFGDRFDYGDAQFLNLQRMLNGNMKLIVSPKTQLYNVFPFLGFFLSDHKKIDTNQTMLQEYFRNVYRDRKDTVDSNDLRSFIDTFISRQREEETRNSNKYFHEDNMAATVGNLFGAGTETTSITLRWGLLLMMKYPHIQGKVQEEIESVIGRERPPQAEDRKRMPYMDAVLHEIQRVGNVVPMNLLHETTRDTTFRGYRIPKGTPVIPLLSSVLSDKTQWETPHQFNPNHFLDAQGKFVKRDAFMPFSAGRRVCLGETLAKMELFLFFTMLLQKFHFRPPQEVSPEQLDLTPTPGITSGPQPFQLCALSH